MRRIHHGGVNRVGIGLHRIFVLALVIAVAGCATWNTQPKARRASVTSLTPTAKEASKPIELDVLENQTMRFADTYVATVAQGVDDYVALPATPLAARSAAVRWKLSQATIAYVNATGPNPVLNMVDMVILATVSRLIMEDELTRIYGKEGSIMLDAQRQLEASAWAGVNRVLKPGLQEDLRANITSWYEAHPHQRNVGAARLQELAAALGKTPQATSMAPNSVFRLLFLDPMAGLDPTARAIQETRQLAERALYYTQRMPSLLNWQVEYLTLELSSRPETKQVLADMERLTKAFESFARLSDQLPKLVNDQREAAVRQVFESLAAEEKKFRELLTETRETLTAGSEMATAVNISVQSLDAFIQSVKPPATTNAVPPATGRRPFDVMEYGQAAGQIAIAAERLNTLVASLDKTTPQVEGLIRHTGAQSKELVDYAYRKALTFLAWALGGLVLALLLYRFIATRLFGRPTRQP